MSKIDPTVRRETVYIGVWVLVFSVLMEAVFLVLSAWDITVLLGNLLGAFAAVLNFFLMGIGVQIATTKEEKRARSVIQTSHSLRLLMLVLFAVVGAVFSCFNLVAVLVPYLFPRIAILFRARSGKK